MSAVVPARPTMGPLHSSHADNSLLHTFQAHIEVMRNLVQCKICIKPLYEPYTLGCGHTYCYSCLSSWFGGTVNRKKKKNCPDCRAQVHLQPSPNYLLRELVHMFISRVELLPEDETIQEHEEAKRSEASQIERDRQNEGEGMFNGSFQRIQSGHHIHFHSSRGPIQDAEDGVDRCPECAWELEDGICMHCGYNDEEASYFSDEDEGSLQSAISINSELDGELIAEDGAEDLNEDHDHHHHMFGFDPGYGHRHFHPRREHLHIDLDEEYPDHSHISVMENNQQNQHFIHPTRHHLHQRPGGPANSALEVPRAPINYSRAEGGNSNTTRIFNNPYDTESSATHDSAAAGDSDSEDDEEMESFIDDEDGGSDETTGEGSAGRGPYHEGEIYAEESRTAETFYDVGSSVDDSDEDDGGTTQGSPSVDTSDEDTETPGHPRGHSAAPTHNPRRPAARIVADSDEDTDTNSDSEEDDDEEEAPIQNRRRRPSPPPPQPTADRVARANTHRAHRATGGRGTFARERGRGRGRGRR